MEAKRTIEVSEEQINLIKQALGIAELKFANIQKEIIEDTVVVRGVDSTSEQVKISNYYHDKSCEFAELNIALGHSELDV